MISSDAERPCPEVRSPVADGLNQLDELPFIGCQFGVSGSDRMAEEGDRALALVEDIAKTRAGGITLNENLAVEVGQMQDRAGGERGLEGIKRLGRVVGPVEGLLLQEGSERGREHPRSW